MGDAGKKLRWMEIGSQYMSAAEKRRIRDLFPNARIVQHYGLTEASRSTFLRISGAPDELLESVGRPVGQTEIGISTDGHIQIRGPHVAQWRLDGDQLRALPNAEGWLITSDLGHVKDGYLYFDGRADDLINSGGVKVNPDQLEARINRLLSNSGKLVVTKVPDALRGEGVLVVTDAQDVEALRLRNAAMEALKGLGLDVGDALHVKVATPIPVTATGKPQRRLLTEAFVRSAPAPEATAAKAKQTTPKARDVMGFFQQFFPGRRIEPDDSFESLGGDSLGYIQFSMGFEDRFGALPSGWEALTVTELQSSVSSATGKFSWVAGIRNTGPGAFFMICIVALHFDTFIYSKNWGAAYFLFLLAGYSLMRFQWPEISRSGKVTTVLSTVVRIAIPTVLAVASLQLWARQFELKPLLLFSNLFDPREYKVAYFYFAEIYMQLLLLMAGLLSFKSAREAFQKRPPISSTILLCAPWRSAMCPSSWTPTTSTTAPPSGTCGRSPVAC
ncbi:MAG: AMP-binding protein [Burkholderiaceae bacterium]